MARAVGKRAYSGLIDAGVVTVEDPEQIEQMIDSLRRMRNRCEPKSKSNPVYFHFSGAISNLKWLLEQSGEFDLKQR